MSKSTNNKAILKENRYLIIRILMQKKTIREIATQIGTNYDPLYNYLATGEILHDKLIYEQPS